MKLRVNFHFAANGPANRVQVLRWVGREPIHNIHVLPARSTDGRKKIYGMHKHTYNILHDGESNRHIQQEKMVQNKYVRKEWNRKVLLIKFNY